MEVATAAPAAIIDEAVESDAASMLTEAPDEAIEVEAPAATMRILTFRLDDQLFAIPIGYVQEIQQIVELMPLPDAAPALVGMLDLRGAVVPAIDLRTLVGMPRREYTLETPMVFCHVHGRTVCLIVDMVEDVVEVPSSSLQPASKLYAMADRMIGVCRLDQGLVMIFDPERLVPDEALVAADEAGGLVP
jgi:chemotaxis signal transduction protein